MPIVLAFISLSGKTTELGSRTQRENRISPNRIAPLAKLQHTCMSNTFSIPYHHATYRTPVPIIDCPHILLLWIIDQQQDSELLAWKKFNTTMPPEPYCYTSTQELSRKYRIALNFRGSKFSRMVVFEDFTEIISRIHCLNHAHATHVM